MDSDRQYHSFQTNDSTPSNISDCVNIDELPKSYSSFSVLHLNAGSGGLGGLGKIEMLRDLLGEEAPDIDVAVVSETWLNSANMASFGVNDFEARYSNRDNGSRGGGVGCFVRSNCKIQSSSARSSPDGNVQAIRLRIKKVSFEGYVIGFYSSNFAHCEQLLSILEQLIPTDSPLPCVILGDSNVNLLPRPTDPGYLSFFTSRDFSHLVDRVTRPSSGTCLDHVAIRNFENFIQVSPYVWRTPLFSDHYPVLLTVAGNAGFLPRSDANGSSYKVRRHDRVSVDRFVERIRAANWIDVLQASDPDVALEAFSGEIRDKYESCFPLGSGLGRRRPYEFRFSPGLRRLRANVGKVYRWFRKTGTAGAEAAYKGSLRRFRSALAKSRRSFHENSFNKFRNDAARMWRFVRNICGRGTGAAVLPEVINTRDGAVSEPVAVANELNRHFVDVGNTAVGDFVAPDNIGPLLGSLWKPRVGLSLGSIAQSDTLRELTRTGASWRAGVTGVPDKLLSVSAAHIACPLTHIFNLSLRSGVFPSALKDAKVIPLYKRGGDRRTAGSYRPISMVDFLSKILERLVCSRIQSDLEKSGFLSSSQYGFRGNRSTELALVNLWHTIIGTVESHGFALGAFLDLAAAFNCLRHSYFIQMLAALGYDHATQQWFKSYLSSRTQSVKVGEVESSRRFIDLGTPQGSVAGPLIFIIYINFVLIKLLSVCGCKIVTYADDTTFVFPIGSSTCQEDMAKAALKIEESIVIFRMFGLVINTSKTKLVLFRSTRRKVSILPVKIGDSLLELSQSAKCLGLTLSENLNWFAHLEGISSKCYSVVASLRRLREVGVPQQGLLCVYKALFIPLLFYGVSVWGGGYCNVVQRAAVIQNDAMRAIFDKRRHESVSPLYSQNGLLTVNQIVRAAVAVLAFKTAKGIVPNDIALRLIPTTSRTSRRPTTYETPFARHVFSRQSPAFRLPTVWGSIPRELRSLNSLKKFRAEFEKTL